MNEEKSLTGPLDPQEVFDLFRKGSPTAKDIAELLFEEEQARKEAAALEDNLLSDYAIALRDLRNEKTVAEENLKTLNTQIEDATARLVAVMKAKHLTAFKLKAVGNFIHTKECFPRVINEEKFFQMLEELGKDYLIKPTIHSATLRSLVNGNERDGVPSLVNLVEASMGSVAVEILNQVIDLNFIKDRIQIRKA